MLMNKPREYSIVDAYKQNFQQNVKHLFIDAVVNELLKCLPDCEELSNFGIFDPQKVPSPAEERDAFQKWGKDQLAVLEHMYTC